MIHCKLIFETKFGLSSYCIHCLSAIGFNVFSSLLMMIPQSAIISLLESIQSDDCYPVHVEGS